MFTKRFTATQSSSIPKTDWTIRCNVCPSSVCVARVWRLCARPCLAKELSRCDLRGSVLPSLSLSEFTKSLSNVPRGVSFPLKCLSLFNNTLFVDQWPFSVALLQFGVYLSLILAIKSFAFETQTWRLLALSDWICVVFGCTTSSTSTEWAKRNPSRCPLLILDINES